MSSGGGGAAAGIPQGKNLALLANLGNYIEGQAGGTALGDALRNQRGGVASAFNVVPEEGKAGVKGLLDIFSPDVAASLDYSAAGQRRINKDIEKAGIDSANQKTDAELASARANRSAQEAGSTERDLAIKRQRRRMGLSRPAGSTDGSLSSLGASFNGKTLLGM